MWVWYGAQALSTHKELRLLNTLQASCRTLSAISARQLFLIQPKRELESSELEKLERLLNSGQEAPSKGRLFFVVPRAGTRSPWSTKATEILHTCGLEDAIERVERGLVYAIEGAQTLDAEAIKAISAKLHDQMTEQVLLDPARATTLFEHSPPAPLEHIPLMAQGRQALTAANRDRGLALSDEELDYLAERYQALQRDPTDVELMMFAQANSEHCRHKIFGASWELDGQLMPHSLFGMIRHTHEQHPQGTISAYKDNAAIFEGSQAQRTLINPQTRQYERLSPEPAHILIKVETHNHPTAISPNPGAATGSGGELRDEGATGLGGSPKAGLVGFNTSHLRIPQHLKPWERDDPGRPKHQSSPLQIMLEAPIGAASYNNEFGRPALCGYHRDFELKTQRPGDEAAQVRGYHKPIMIAGGLGNIRPMHTHKRAITDQALVVILGGPAMLIGLGGGAASSVDAGTSDQALDFASVQRANPEMERRCQEVIERCIALGERNPILSIHDVGAGGLSNAVPELVEDAGLGAQLKLRAIPNAEPGLSPLAIWCNEAQERYVLAILSEDLPRLEQIAKRERCPMATIGHASAQRQLTLHDDQLEQTPIDIPMNLLFGHPPKMHRQATTLAPCGDDLDPAQLPLEEAALRVLSHPTVASKKYLITIGDRSVTGLVARDQLVGPWQVPVSDVAVTFADHLTKRGEAMSIGERPPVALLSGPASARLAVSEALLNLAAADVRLSQVKLSANWMVAAGHPGEDATLYRTVEALGLELCPALGVSIPVGKDSMSMRTSWEAEDGAARQVISPLSVVISAFAPVTDALKTWTPQLVLERGAPATSLVLVRLNDGPDRLGGSILAQCYSALGQTPPDLDEPSRLKAALEALSALRAQGLILAYHDRSDGGLFVTLCEMAFAARCGMVVDLAQLGAVSRVNAALFSEEPGFVVQVYTHHLEQLRQSFERAGLPGECVVPIAKPMRSPWLLFMHGTRTRYALPTFEALRAWSLPSHMMQRLRDNPANAEQELETDLDPSDPGLSARVDARAFEALSAPYLSLGARPKVAILREQGVNGHVEMAQAWMRAGFDAIDVHMSDLHDGSQRLDEFKALAACGGFSYGDVLGAGRGWGATIMEHDALRQQFEAFFQREDTLTLGVCNGCQMLSSIKALIPGAQAWPRFERNVSEQFEARLGLVRVSAQTDAVMLQGLKDSWMPCPIAHGEGRAQWDKGVDKATIQAQTALSYVNGHGQITMRYPANPNGSTQGVAGVSAAMGRVLVMMPHPERGVRGGQLSWRPASWGVRSPWLNMFEQALRWIKSLD